MHKKPYPTWFDDVPMPQRYRIPEFTKFSGQDNTSTGEHITRFLIQCGEAANVEPLRVKLFPMSLSGAAFSWFASLPPNSINGWNDLQQQFNNYFYAGVMEMKLSYLSSVKQRTGEPVQDYIQRFRDVRRRCYSLNITDAQLADLAFQGLIGPIKDRFATQEFMSLAHLVQKILAHEARYQDSKKERFQSVSYADESNEEEIDMAEWTRVKKSVNCPYGTNEKEVRYAFDVTKADLIFDMLL